MNSVRTNLMATGCVVVSLKPMEDVNKEIEQRITIADTWPKK